MASEYFLVRRGATALPNRVIWSDLSYEALGVLARALSMPESAPKGYRAFVNRGLGASRARAALRELEEAGLRFRFQGQYRGRVTTLVVFTDTPALPGEVAADLAASLRERGEQVLRIVGCQSHEIALEDLQVIISQELLGEEDEEEVSKGASSSADDSECLRRSPRRCGNVSAVDTSHHVLTDSRVSLGCGGAIENGAPERGAHISKDISISSSLCSDDLLHPSVPGADRVSVDGVDDGCSVVDASPAVGGDGSFSGAEGLVRRALPDPLAGWLVGKALQIVADFVAQMLDSGWTVEQVRGRLEQVRVPAQVRNPPGYVISLLKAVSGEMAPSRAAEFDAAVVQARRERREREARERARAAREAHEAEVAASHSREGILRQLETWRSLESSEIGGRVAQARIAALEAELAALDVCSDAGQGVVALEVV